MDLRDPRFQTQPTCSMGLGPSSTRLRKMKDGSLQAVPPCSDCNARDVDCDVTCPDEEWCETFCCNGCKFKSECNDDTWTEPHGEPVIAPPRYTWAICECTERCLDISALAIESIDNGWILSYANEDGEDHQQYFKDTESICKFLTEHLRRS